MTLPRILRQPSKKNPFTKRSEVSLVVDPYEDLLLRDIDIPTEFDIIKTLHEGSFSKVLLVRKRHCTRERLTLKVISDENLEYFYRELNYNYFLSPHPNIVKCYNVSILWEDSFVFPMEYAPFGNLEKLIGACDPNPMVLTEASIKLVAKQLASALAFMHSFKLVHRDVCPENVLVFKQDFTQIKLCDFGSTRPEKSLVTCLSDRRDTSPCPGTSMANNLHINSRHSPRPASLNTGNNNTAKDLFRLPPEICGLVKGESYYTHSSGDVWQFGILLYSCLTGGGEPWQSADDILDPGFAEFLDWTRRKSLRIPEPFQIFTPRLLRLFKRTFEPKPKKRCGIEEVYKYLDDEWMAKLYRGSSFRRGVLERKASSSTSRSRSTGRNSSTRRKSVRINSGSCNGVNNGRSSPNNNIVKESTPAFLECREKMSELDRDFVKERVGQWILEAASAAKPVSTT